MGAGYRPVFLNELVNVMITLGDVSVRGEALVGSWGVFPCEIVVGHGYRVRHGTTRVYR